VPQGFKGKYRIEMHPNVGPFEFRNSEQWYGIEK
jgi:hypothetical protein